jgi:hypothetical protein
MTTHKLTILEGTEQKTFFTVAPNVAEAVDKVRRYLKENNREAVIETCSPKPSLTIVESVSEPQILELEVVREPVNGKADDSVTF